MSLVVRRIAGWTAAGVLALACLGTAHAQRAHWQKTDIGMEAVMATVLI